MVMNINSYFEVDWAATKHNLKSMLYESTTEAALAKALYVEPRTIRYWLDGETELDISHLIIFAKYLDVDLFDILVYKGQFNRLTKEDVLDTINNLSTDDYVAELESDHSDAADFISTVLMNEYSSQKTAIRNLTSFLIYMPLLDPHELKDALHRMQGNFNHHAYLQAQLQRLYDSIPNSPAKRYADSFCYYALTFPYAHHIKESTKQGFFKQKLYSFESWKRAASTEDEHNEYNRLVRIFLKRLTSFEQLQRLTKDLAEDATDSV